MPIHPELDHSQPLTAWDYMNAPIVQLVQHPDFNRDRWERLCNALAEASLIIQRAYDID